MELPQEITLLLAALIGFVVTNGLKALFPAWDITGVAAKITAALVTCAIALSEQGLAMVPAEYHTVVISIFALIVSVLGAYGIHFTIKSARQ